MNDPTRSVSLSAGWQVFLLVPLPLLLLAETSGINANCNPTVKMRVTPAYCRRSYLPLN